MWHSCVQVQAWLYVESLVDSSLHGEAAGFLHGRQQLLIKLLVGLVWRDVYSVETGDKKKNISLRRRAGGGEAACLHPHHVWALGRLSVLASIKWMVKSLGPAEPVEPYTDTF